jgi:hypothetical protein
VAKQEVEYPFIVHTVRKVYPHPTKDGASSKDIAIVAVNSCDNDPDGAQDQADSIRALLDEYSGMTASVNIEKIRFQDEGCGYDEEAKAYFTLQTYKIWINYAT